MSSADPPNSSHRSQPALRALAIGPAPRFALGAAALAIGVFAGALALTPGPAIWPAGLVTALYGLAMGGVLAAVRAQYPHGHLGACNLVTLGRAALAAILLTPVITPAALTAAPWAVFALAAVALFLDGLDGWLARRAGLSSSFGARFDMEVDAALAAILSLVLIRSGAMVASWEIASLLILGFARYGFVAASLVLPWLARPLPDRFGRKAVCVLQIGTLIAALLPVTPQGLGNMALPSAAAFVLWSFGRDILWLWRRRAGPRP